MNNKFTYFLIIFLFSISCSFGDELDSVTDINRSWEAQKPITNQEFENAIDTLQKKQKQSESKKKKKRIKKISGGGTSLHPNLDPLSEIQTQNPLQKKDDEGQLVNIPVDMLLDGKVLEKGFYNVFAKKNENNEIYITLYQSLFPKGTIKAFETKEDFDEDNINYAKYELYNEHYIKIIYGSLDFNAFGYIQYLQ